MTPNRQVEWDSVLKSALARGLSRSELARELGYRPCTVSAACKRLSVSLPMGKRGRKPKPVPYTGGAAGDISDSDMSMMSNRQLAAALCSTEKYANKVRSKRGVPTPAASRHRVVMALLEMSGLNGKVSPEYLRDQYPGVRAKYCKRKQNITASHPPDGVRRIVGTTLAISRCGERVFRLGSDGSWHGRTFGRVAGRHSVTVDGVRIPRAHAVYLAWNGPIPPDMEVDHIDGDNSNDHADNLEVVSPSENKRRYSATRGQMYGRTEEFRYTTCLRHWLSRAGAPETLFTP